MYYDGKYEYLNHLALYLNGYQTKDLCLRYPFALYFDWLRYVLVSIAKKIVTSCAMLFVFFLFGSRYETENYMDELLKIIIILL